MTGNDALEAQAVVAFGQLHPGFVARDIELNSRWVIEPVNEFDLRSNGEFRIVESAGVAEFFQLRDGIGEAILETAIEGSLGIMNRYERFDVIRRGVRFGVNMFAEIGLYLACDLAASGMDEFTIIAFPVAGIGESTLKRGFSEELRSDAERLTQLTKDTVGLVGEVGEFANLLKKVELALRIDGYEGASLDVASAELREELADAMIYIIRLSTTLGGDIENDLLQKMAKNDQRYRHLEK